MFNHSKAAVQPGGGHTFRKWRVAMKRGVSFSWFLAHCSARGDKASKHSWLISELMLQTSVKEDNLQDPGFICDKQQKFCSCATQTDTKKQGTVDKSKHQLTSASKSLNRCEFKSMCMCRSFFIFKDLNFILKMKNIPLDTVILSPVPTKY